MAGLERFIGVIDGLNDRIGRAAAWLVLPVIWALFLQIPMRQFVGFGHREVNDIGQLLHAALFMTAIAYALRWDSHVRVDIFYRAMSERHRALVDLVGTVALLWPWLGLLGWYSWPVVLSSWRDQETFLDAGTPGYFLMKALLLVLAALLGLQSFAKVANSVLILRQK